MNYGPPSQDQPNLNWDQPLNLFSTDLSSQETAEIPCFTNDTLSSMHANRLLPFPAFSADSYAAIAGQFCLSEPGRLSRVSSSKALKADESPIQSEIGDGDSSVTNIASVSGDRFMKKRKAAPKSKAKVEEENDLNSKKCRSFEDSEHDDGGVRPKEDQIQNGDKKNRKVNGSNATEPPTGYIHVRARRGQATDSHSLAERVRREKISQRMKLLQDLVPGCNKITGKALMLDEIINYVQSLQRQVEFLSMKLATVNPQLDFSFEDFIKKEVHLAAALPLAHQPKDGNHPFPLNFASAIDPSCPISQFEPFLYQSSSIQASLDMFIGSNSQAGNLLDDVLQASFVQNQEIGMRSQSFHGQLPATHMKIEF